MPSMISTKIVLILLAACLIIGGVAGVVVDKGMRVACVSSGAAPGSQSIQPSKLPTSGNPRY